MGKIHTASISGPLLEVGAVWSPAITRYKLAEAAQAHQPSERREFSKSLYDGRNGTAPLARLAKGAVFRLGSRGRR